MRQQASELIERLHAEHIEEMEEAAIGYVLVSRDEVVGSLYVMGVFDTPEAATAHKEKLDVEDGEGWAMSVHRLMPVD
jgi:predicted transcriptional regulator YheO